MTKQVAFSNDAYAALQGEKREDESFSDLVLRLMREARMARKDPMRWAHRPRKFLLSPADFKKEIEWGRAHDRPDPWLDSEKRKVRDRGRQAGDGKAGEVGTEA